MVESPINETIPKVLADTDTAMTSEASSAVVPESAPIKKSETDAGRSVAIETLTQKATTTTTITTPSNMNSNSTTLSVSSLVTPVTAPMKRGRGRAKKIVSEIIPIVEVISDSIEIVVPNTLQTTVTTIPTTTTLNTNEKRVGRKRKQVDDSSSSNNNNHHHSDNSAQQQEHQIKTEEDALDEQAIGAKSLDASTDGKKTRRSVRLGNRMDGFKILVSVKTPT